MAYRDLRRLFHMDEAAYEEEYQRRFNAETTVHVDILINGSPAFLVITPELYEASLRAAKLDKEILALTAALPPQAVQQYMDQCLIDEIVVTNGIEGVRSTRKEIGEVLDGLRKQGKRGRFVGLVRKYLMLRTGQRVPLDTCEDIRMLYDELVLPEVLAEDPKDAPDGLLFRKGQVSVVSLAQTEIHRGISPEEALIAALDEALTMLEDQRILPLARIGAFHFLFGFAHPFYNGNGRVNRFISSYLLANEYESIVGLKLSGAVQAALSHYYKAFEVCEHKLNRGDMTPFVLMFAGVVVAAMEDARNALRERREKLRAYEAQIERMPAGLAGRDMREVLQQLLVATLFSANGTTVPDLCAQFGLTRQTVYERLKPLRAAGVLVEEQIGHKIFLRLDLVELEEIHG